MANNKKKNEEPVNAPAPPAAPESQDPPAAPIEDAPVIVDPPVDAIVDEQPWMQSSSDPAAPEAPIEQEFPREGFAFLVAPDDVTGCSVDGVEYSVDSTGVVEVAADHVATLVERGFEHLDA